MPAPGEKRVLPQLRPVFPGIMRFVIDPKDVGRASTPIIIDANGVIDPTCLEKFAGIMGSIIISLAPPHLRAAATQGVIPQIGEPPTHAWYGPVRLTKAFLEKTLLDNETGMLPSAITDGEKTLINPGDKGWQEAALRAFLLGDYYGVLRAGAAADGSDDDAVRCQMPELSVDATKPTDLLLNVAFGWMRRARPAPDFPDPQTVEAIPARAFLQHVSKQMIDVSQNPASNGSAIDAVLQGQFDVQHWSPEFDKAVSALGFATTSGHPHPISYKLREFQIAAQNPFVAQLNQTDPQTSERDLRNLAWKSSTLPRFNQWHGERGNAEARRVLDGRPAPQSTPHPCAEDGGARRRRKAAARSGANC